MTSELNELQSMDEVEIRESMLQVWDYHVEIKLHELFDLDEEMVTTVSIRGH
jgi:hypothetical protein